MQTRPPLGNSSPAICDDTNVLETFEKVKSLSAGNFPDQLVHLRNIDQSGATGPWASSESTKRRWRPIVLMLGGGPPQSFRHAGIDSEPGSGTGNGPRNLEFGEKMGSQNGDLVGPEGFEPPTKAL